MNSLDEFELLLSDLHEDVQQNKCQSYTGTSDMVWRARGGEFLGPGLLLGGAKQPTRPSPWPSPPRARPNTPMSVV